MKKLFFAASLSVFMTAACQSSATKEALKGQQLAQQAIAVHDEIMPQISVFNKMSVKIDSILGNMSAVTSAKADVDTTALKTELQTLKTNLESATDNMMTWMHGYVADSTDVAYQQSELEKVKAMQKHFEEVALESNKILSSLK